MKIKEIVKRFSYSIFEKSYPNLRLFRGDNLALHLLKSYADETRIERSAKLYKPYKIIDSEIGGYTYIAENSHISMTSIGKFCSVGPNFICGWGIHPTNGISTSPMFYSTIGQNGVILTKENKIEERKAITIGNDVFIGMNVTGLDGVHIGDGAVIGAGAVVSKSIPAYAIAVGSPIQIVRYRFTEMQIQKLLKIRWWDFDKEKLDDVEKLFFEIDAFIAKYE